MSKSRALPSWVQVLPVIYIALTLLAPGISFGTFRLFLGDLFCFIWVPIYGAMLFRQLDELGRKRLLLVATSIVLVLSAVYLHGSQRFFVYERLGEAHIQGLVPEVFQPVKEGLIAGRFVLWTIGGLLATWGGVWNPLLVLRASVGVTSFINILAWVFPSVALALGEIYGYQPFSNHNWFGRTYGVFSSPVEGALFVSLAVAVLWSVTGLKNSSDRALAFAGAFAVATTQTLTPLVGCVAGALVFGLRSGRARVRRGVSLGIALIVVAAILGRRYFPNFYEAKWNDLTYRFAPWKIYMDAALTRWDRILLGQGFTSFHVDNSYLFLFNRGGVAWLGLMVALGVQLIRRGKRSLSPAHVAAFAVFLVDCVVFDAAIYRPVVALIVVTWIPLVRPELNLGLNTAKNKDI